MKKIHLHILLLLAVIICAGMLYESFSTKSKLNEALGQIDKAEQKVKLAQDSLQKAQNTIQEVLIKLDSAETHLHLLKTERDLLAMKEQQSYTKDKVELADFKITIKRMEARRDSLVAVAKTFAL